jgi:hypothetical protein
VSVTNVTGVLSRYFVVGFFLPAYAAIVSAWFYASPEFIPDGLEGQSQTTTLLILGGAALVIGLALSGMSHYVIRLFEGYPLERLSDWPLVGSAHRFGVALQRRRYETLISVRDDTTRSGKERGRAGGSLDRNFPQDREALLPTRLGNVIRAFERHSNTRWGLDGVTVWPRIESLLSPGERELHVDSKVNVYVFLNGAMGTFMVGVFLVVDKAVNDPQPFLSWPFNVIPFVVAYVLYLAAIAPARDWGDCIRSSIDLHRLELYEKLGVRSPTSFTDELDLARKVNRALLYGHPLLTDDLWR